MSCQLCLTAEFDLKEAIEDTPPDLLKWFREGTTLTITILFATSIEDKSVH